MAAADHHTWLWNKIGQQESIEDLEAFAQRFENDLKNFEFIGQLLTIFAS